MIQGMTAERGVDFVICGLCGGQFRAISNSHLTRRHGFDPENPIRDYLEMFGLESAECVETRQQQKESFREHLDRHGRSWSAERVCREISRLREMNEPLNSKNIVLRHQQLMISAREFYGTWDRALEAAGVEVDQVRLHARWTPEKILGRIRELSGQGCSLAYTECNTRGDGLAQAARRAFGDWKSALQAAGIEAPVPYRHAERAATGPTLSLPAAAAAPSQEALPPVHEWPVQSPVVA